MDEKAFIQSLLRAWNSRDPHRILDYYDEHYRGEEVSDPREQYGREGVQRMLDKFFTAFPDLEVQPLDWVLDGRKLCVFWEARGTHGGVILNIPPTGKRIRVRGASFLHLENGRIVRGNHLWDMAAMLRHMGLLPALS